MRATTRPDSELKLAQCKQSSPVQPKIESFLHAASNLPLHIPLSSLSLQIETHIDGQRVRYFQDDDNVALKEMVRREKMSSAQDQNALYSRMAAKVRKPYCNLSTAGLR